MQVGKFSQKEHGCAAYLLESLEDSCNRVTKFLQEKLAYQIRSCKKAYYKRFQKGKHMARCIKAGPHKSCVAKM